MSKKSYAIKNTSGSTIFTIKLNPRHVEEIKNSVGFQVDMKKNIIANDIFDIMFQNTSHVQALTWNQYTCSVCRKQESFLVDKGEVYCIGCYSFVNKNQATSADFLIQNSLTNNVVAYDLYVVNQKDKVKNKFGKRDGATSYNLPTIDDILSIANSVEESNSKHNRIAKFQEKIHISAQKQKEQNNKAIVTAVIEDVKSESKKVENFYNKTCLSEIISRLSDFETKLNNIGQGSKIDFLYYYHIIQSLKPVAFSMKKMFGIKDSSTLEDLSLIRQEIIQNSNHPEIVKYFKSIDVADFIKASGGYYQLNDIEQLSLVFMSEENCQLCLKATNGKESFVNLYDKTLNIHNVDSIAKCCPECADMFNNYSLLEIFALKSLKKEKVRFSLVGTMYFLAEYEAVSKLVNKVSSSNQFKELQNDFIYYYSFYLEGITSSLGINNKHIKGSILKLMELKILFQELLNKVS